MTPWTIARQAPLSMGFSRQEYWSGLPFSPPGHLPQRGIEPTCPALAGGCFTSEPPGKPTEKQSGPVFPDAPWKKDFQGPCWVSLPSHSEFPGCSGKMWFCELSFYFLHWETTSIHYVQLDRLSAATVNPTLACRDTIQDKPTIVTQSLEMVIGSRGRLGIKKGPITIILGEQLLYG